MRKMIFILLLAVITQAQGNLFGNSDFGNPPQAVLPSDETLNNITAYNEKRPSPGLRQAPGEDGAAQKEDAIPVGGVNAAILITFLLSYGLIMLKKKKHTFE